MHRFTRPLTVDRIRQKMVLFLEKVENNFLFWEIRYVLLVSLRSGSPIGCEKEWRMKAFHPKEVPTRSGVFFGYRMPSFYREGPYS